MNTDVLLVALAHLEQDARTLNLARALQASGLSVAVVASATSTDHPFTVIPWNDPGGSAKRRWLSLSTFVRSLDIRTRVVAGMDLFALGPARSIARRSSKLSSTRSSGSRPTALVYDMREFYFALGPLHGRRASQKILEGYERYLLRSVDRVIVSAPLDATVVQEHYRLSTAPTVLLNTPPFKESIESTVLRSTYAIDPEHCVVVYQGVVHHGRGIAPFITAMPLMPDVHLCIVGSGPAVEELRHAAASAGVADRTHWMGSVPYDELHAVTCSADIGLCLIEPVSLSYEYALPNKLFEYMMAGIPSLITDLPALRQQVQQIPAGMLVGRGLAPADIRDAVARLRVPATAVAMREAATAVRALCYEQQAGIAVDLFRELL